MEAVSQVDMPVMETMPDRDRVRLMVVGVALALAALATWFELALNGGFQAQALCKAAFLLLVVAAWPLTSAVAPLAVAGPRWTLAGRAVLAGFALGAVGFFIGGESVWIPFLVFGLFGLIAWMVALARTMHPRGSWWWPAAIAAGLAAYVPAPGVIRQIPALAVLAIPSLGFVAWGAYPGRSAMAVAEPPIRLSRGMVGKVAGPAIVIALLFAVSSPQLRNALFPPHGISPQVAHLPLTAPSSCGLDRSQAKVYLLPLTPGGDRLHLKPIAAGLNRRYGWHIGVLPPLALTRSAADVGRRQLTVQKVWRSVIDRCSVSAGSARIGVIGVTTLDMWSTDYPEWVWLYSQRFTDDAVPGAIISTARLSDSINPGRPLDQRLRKVVIRDIAVAYLDLPLGSDPMLTTPSSIGELDDLPNDLARRLPPWP